MRAGCILWATWLRRAVRVCGACVQNKSLMNLIRKSFFLWLFRKFMFIAPACAYDILLCAFRLCIVLLMYFFLYRWKSLGQLASFGVFLLIYLQNTKRFRSVLHFQYKLVIISKIFDAVIRCWGRIFDNFWINRAAN